MVDVPPALTGERMQPSTINLSTFASEVIPKYSIVAALRSHGWVVGTVQHILELLTLCCLLVCVLVAFEGRRLSVVIRVSVGWICAYLKWKYYW